MPPTMTELGGEKTVAIERGEGEATASFTVSPLTILLKGELLAPISAHAAPGAATA